MDMLTRNGLKWKHSLKIMKNPCKMSNINYNAMEVSMRCNTIKKYSQTKNIKRRNIHAAHPTAVITVVGELVGNICSAVLFGFIASSNKWFAIVWFRYMKIKTCTGNILVKIYKIVFDDQHIKVIRKNDSIQKTRNWSSG